MREVMRELVTIVAGVLIALGLDAAWDTQQDRKLEAAALIALRDDFQVNRTRLEGVVEVFSRVEAASDQLVAISIVQASVPRDSLLFLVEETSRGHRFEPQLATFSDLVSSGRLGLLRNQQLRRELALFSGFTDRLQARATTVNGQWRVARTDLGLELYELHPEFRDLESRVPATDLASLVRSEAFRNFVVARRLNAGGAAADHSQALERSERILELLAPR